MDFNRARLNEWVTEEDEQPLPGPPGFGAPGGFAYPPPPGGGLTGAPIVMRF